MEINMIINKSNYDLVFQSFFYNIWHFNQKKKNSKFNNQALKRGINFMSPTKMGVIYAFRKLVVHFFVFFSYVR